MMEWIMQIIDIVLYILIYGSTLIFTSLFAVEMQLAFEKQLEDSFRVNIKSMPLKT